MRHHLDVPVGTDLSFQVFQKRARLRELQAPELDNVNRRLHGLPSQMVERHAFLADRESVIDSWQGETVRFPDERLASRLDYPRKSKR